MKLTAWLAVGLTLVWLALNPRQTALADGGGWPTDTPIPTATSTLMPTESNAPAMELPPVPTVAQATDQTTIQLDLPEIPTVTPEAPKNAAGGSVACWPIALVALLAGVVGLNALRKALRRGSE